MLTQVISVWYKKFIDDMKHEGVTEKQEVKKFVRGK